MRENPGKPYKEEICAAVGTGGETGGSTCLFPSGDRGWSNEVKGCPDNDEARPEEAERARGTMVGDSISGLSERRSSFSSLGSCLVMDQGRIGGELGLSEDEVGGETGPLEAAAAAAIAAAAEAAAWCCRCCCCCCGCWFMLCCIRQ